MRGRGCWEVMRVCKNNETRSMMSEATLKHKSVYCGLHGAAARVGSCSTHEAQSQCSASRTSPLTLI